MAHFPMHSREFYTNFFQTKTVEDHILCVTQYRPKIDRYVTVLEQLKLGGAIYAEQSNIQLMECLFEKK